MTDTQQETIFIRGRFEIVMREHCYSLEDYYEETTLGEYAEFRTAYAALNERFPEVAEVAK